MKICLSLGTKPSSDGEKYYGGALLAAGAEYVAADPEGRAEDYAEVCDGLLLSGGADVEPARYGEPVSHESVRFDEKRDEMEFSLFRAFRKKNKPIFGICRGSQLIYAASGGKLIQHVPAAFPEGEAHRHATGEVIAPEKNIPTHETRIVPGTILAGLLGEKVLTNTYHHQAAEDRPVGGLRISAHAPDGIVEAFEHECDPVYGVQWHPERMRGVPGLSEMESLFAFFVGKCGK